MEDTTVSTPAYRIFRDQHGIPQFSPKRGTQALKDALIYAFPTLETELQLMQAALKKFFDSERGIQIICELPENDLQTSLAKKRDVEISPIQEQKAGLKNWRASNFNGGGIMTTWSLESGRELERKKKGPYDPVKRRKVAENRGNACEKHRTAKSACDPMICPQNKMFGKVPDDSQAGYQAARRGESQINIPSPAPSGPNANAAIDISNTMNLTNDTVPTPPREFAMVPGDADVFWDAADQVNTQEAILSFGHLSTSSYAGSWTDSSYTDLLSWSPNSSCLTAPDSMRGSLAPAPEIPHLASLPGADIASFDPTVEQGDLAQRCPMQHYPSLSYPSPSDDAAAQQQLAAPIAQAEQTLTCSEDPFMGWASKKANQVFDDYGWVLSHVETL
ncbi:hypothetical protein EG329_011177 [Mollisiaceae sp. DMI_Dod_QoI]|nr:hypothetical protein EG329_011177 [Helotiales sp. DMI_Dod_QoI]